MNLDTNHELLRWETPFADAAFPSVFIVGDEGDDSRELTVLVAPRGLDEYPKYIVRFRAVFAYLSEEEGQWSPSDERPERFRNAADVKCSAVCVSGSFWWKAYGEQVRHFHDVEPAHFFLFGGDNNVEVFAASTPSIERIDGPTVLTLTHAV